MRATDPQGDTIVVNILKEPMGHRDFYGGGDSKISHLLRESGVVREGKVGVAQAFLTTAQEMGDFVMRQLEENPRVLLCDRPDCKFCSRF